MEPHLGSNKPPSGRNKPQINKSKLHLDNDSPLMQP